MVLDGLEGADRSAELLAHLRVLDRHLQAGPAHADRLRRRQDPEHRACPPRGAAQDPVLGDGDVTKSHRSDGAGGVEGVQCGDGDAFGARVDDHHIVARDERKHIGIGCTENRGAFPGNDQVRADDHAAGQAERRDRGPVGQARKQLRAKRIRCASVNHHRGRHRRQKRSRAQLPALGFQHNRQLGEPEARTAVLFGDGEAQPAQFCGCFPYVIGMRGAALERGAGACPGRQPGQLAERRVGEILVFVGDG